jgi:hypothetical protein
MSRTPPLPRRAALALLGLLALGLLLPGVRTRGRPISPILRSVTLTAGPLAVALDPPSVPSSSAPTPRSRSWI